MQYSRQENGKSSIPCAYAYAYAYAYVTPVHTYFSYFSYAHVYARAYAYVKVWTSLTERYKLTVLRYKMDDYVEKFRENHEVNANIVFIRV